MSEQLDVGSLRVTELRKELRARGLSANGDKAELAARLQAALSIDELDLTALDEEPDADADADADPDPDPNITTTTTMTAIEESTATPDPPSPPPVAKKIVLNRSTITPPLANPTTTTTTTTSTPTDTPTPLADARPTKLVADSKSRLELRAKRFGVTNNVKEARAARFQTAPTPTPVLDAASATSLDILKKRAKRFGSSVSKFMIKVENSEKLERRKARFGNQPVCQVPI